MRQATEDYVREHPVSQQRQDSDTSTRRHTKDSEIRAARLRLDGAAQRFFTRCHRAGLLSDEGRGRYGTLAIIVAMKTTLQRLAQIQALIFCLLLPLQSRASSFVELAVEIEANDWDYWFFSDRIGKYPGEEGVPSIFTQSRTTHCVVGEDSWMIESEFPSFNVTRWFTGTNIIEHTLLRNPAAAVKKGPKGQPARGTALLSAAVRFTSRLMEIPVVGRA
jgi:hypothetical protein